MKRDETRSEDWIEVTSLSDIYNRDKEDELVLVKKNVQSKEIIFKSDIMNIRQVFNENGNVRTKQVEIGLRSKDPITVIGNYKELKKLIFENPVSRIGFKYGR